MIRRFSAVTRDKLFEVPGGGVLNKSAHEMKNITPVLLPGMSLRAAIGLKFHGDQVKGGRQCEKKSIGELCRFGLSHELIPGVRAHHHQVNRREIRTFSGKLEKRIRGIETEIATGFQKFSPPADAGFRDQEVDDTGESGHPVVDKRISANKQEGQAIRLRRKRERDQ